MAVALKNEKVSLNLFYDEFNLLRSKTRMNCVNDIHFRRVNLFYLEIIVILPNL